MSIAISYKNKTLKKKSSNLIFFVNEKYNLLNLKHHFSKLEYGFIRDILKSQNLSKKILNIDLSSKKKIILISTKSDTSSSQVEKLGAEFYNYLKDIKQREFFINSEINPTKLNNFVCFFLHG